MDIEFTTGWMMTSMLASTVGFGIFLYGKKQARFPQIIAGIAMMVYPGFVSSPMVMLVIGGAIVAGLWGAVRSGM